MLNYIRGVEFMFEVEVLPQLYYKTDQKQITRPESLWKLD